MEPGKKNAKKGKRDYPPGEVPKANMKEMPVGNECLGFPSLPRVCLSDMSAFPYLERCLGSFSLPTLEFAWLQMCHQLGKHSRVGC